MQDRKSTGVRRRQNNVSEKVAGHRRQMSHDPTDTQDTILHAESTEHLPLHGEHRLICVNSDLGIGRRKTTLLTRGRPICPRCRRRGADGPRFVLLWPRRAVALSFHYFGALFINGVEERGAEAGVVMKMELALHCALGTY